MMRPKIPNSLLAKYLLYLSYKTIALQADTRDIAIIKLKA